MSLTDQPNESAPRPRSPFRAMLPYTTALLIVVALYAAWTLYSRHQDVAQAEQSALDQKAEAAKKVNDQIFGSGDVTFSTFEASDGTLRPGQTTQLCYGVVNATSVKLDPPVEQIKPSSRHCMDITPRKTTTYTITASDAKGHTKTLSLTVNVK